MRSGTSKILDQIGAERMKVSERIARLDTERATIAARLTDLETDPPMSRKGDCLDNAPIESFFYSLKTERVHHRIYGPRAEARRDLFQCIEQFPPPAFGPGLYQPSFR
jgi:transposase InsO family protein